MWCTSRASPLSTTNATVSALLGSHQMVVHRRDGQQRRDRRLGVVGVAVGNDQRPSAFGDRFARADAEVLKGVGQSFAAAFDVVERPQHSRLEAGMLAVVVDVHDLVEFVVVEHRPAQHDLPTRGRRRFQQVLLGPHHPGHRGDDLLADGVQRWIGHLGEEFHEVVVKQSRPLREHGGRRIGTHRAQRFGAGGGHRRQQDAQVLFGVPERDLAAHHRLVVGLHPDPIGKGLQVEKTRMQPFAVRFGVGQFTLDFVVRDDPAGRGVDQEHLSGLEAALGHDLGGRHVEHAALTGEDDPVVDRAPPASRT